MVSAMTQLLTAAVKAQRCKTLLAKCANLVVSVQQSWNSQAIYMVVSHKSTYEKALEEILFSVG